MLGPTMSPLRRNPPRNVPSRNSGTMQGSLSGWRPPRTYSYDQQASERALSQGRAEDLSANDWAASSGINAITTNAVGTGLKPQSRINAKRLGLTEDEASDLQADIEAVWTEWTPHAHVSGMLHFEDLQFLGLRTMLRLGELVHVPVMLPAQDQESSSFGRTGIRLAIQDVKPSRLRTPFDLQRDPRIVDGIQFSSYGAPEQYWIATPPQTIHSVYEFNNLTSQHFTQVPAQVGHRRGCFHLFRYMEDEQIRGHSILSSGVNLFRHLSDSLDNELLAQVVTASMAVFISREQGTGLPDYVREESDNEDKLAYHEDIEAGTVLYGNSNEKPHVLENSRPSPNFATFSEFVLRAMAASIDMPYEILSKDFSKTNYSSARAALLEAWRVFTLYRTWLVRHYCQPIWSMVIEEAWLSGKLKIPSKAPDFYDAPNLYTQATWIGPSRGYIDPVKEVKSKILEIENNLTTRSEVLAENGRDFDDTMATIERENRRLAKLKPQQEELAGKKEVSHVV